MGVRTQKLNDLFKRWSDTYGAQAKYFVADGIICEAQWNAASRKVLFLMREATIGGDLRTQLAWIAAEKNYRGWPRIAGGWAFGLQHASAESIPPFETAMERWGDALAASAVVHLKKLMGRTSSQPGVLLAAAQHDASLLREELDIIRPDIVVCCGTFDTARRVMSMRSQGQPPGSDDMYFRQGDAAWVRSYHPAAPAAHSERAYAALTGIWQNLVLAARKA